MTQTAAPRYMTNGKAPPADRRLGQSHLDMLVHDSGIAPAIVAQRDAWTAINPKELASIGFAGHQQLTPALVLPVWSVGAPWCCGRRLHTASTWRAKAPRC